MVRKYLENTREEFILQKEEFVESIDNINKNDLNKKEIIKLFLLTKLPLGYLLSVRK